MNVKELIEKLGTMPKDATIFLGIPEYRRTADGRIEKEGFILFPIEEDEVDYYSHTWSYGNSSPRMPLGETNVVVFTR